MNTLDYRLLNEFQRDFPLCASPYAKMGHALGIDEADTIAALKRFRQDGKTSRVGAVFRPHTVSASTPWSALALQSATIIRGSIAGICGSSLPQETRNNLHKCSTALRRAAGAQ